MKQLKFFDNEPEPAAPAVQPKVYSAQDYLQHLADDLGVYDIRNWPNGITPGEVQRLYETFDQPEGWGFFNSGHGLYCLRHLKGQGVPADRIRETILANRERHLKTWRASWERDLDWYWNCYLDNEDPKQVEQGLGHARECYRTLCRVHEELKMTPPQKPAWLDYSPEAVLKEKDHLV
jgi:hypothetical protein